MKFEGSILIVDDEAHIRKFVGLILRQLGVGQLHEARNGTEALAIFARERPGIVLLDVNMPITDGLETLKKLRAIDPGCVVIMLTSLTTRHTVESALEAGANNYLRKDTPKEEIAKALQAAIDECRKPEPTP